MLDMAKLSDLFHIIINREQNLIEGQIFNPQVLRPYSSSKKKKDDFSHVDVFSRR